MIDLLTCSVYFTCNHDNSIHPRDTDLLFCYFLVFGYYFYTRWFMAYRVDRKKPIRFLEIKKKQNNNNNDDDKPHSTPDRVKRFNPQQCPLQDVYIYIYIKVMEAMSIKYNAFNVVKTSYYVLKPPKN